MSSLINTIYTITASGNEFDTITDATSDENAAWNHKWLSDTSYLADPSAVITVRRLDIFADGSITTADITEAIVTEDDESEDGYVITVLDYTNDPETGWAWVARY